MGNAKSIRPKQESLTVIETSRDRIHKMHNQLIANDLDQALKIHLGMKVTKKTDIITNSKIRISRVETGDFEETETSSIE